MAKEQEEQDERPPQRVQGPGQQNREATPTVDGPPLVGQCMKEEQ